jgi:glycosyltransferase involved in cell wall biosynthesis
MVEFLDSSAGPRGGGRGRGRGRFHDVVAVIPAYNAGATIEALVRKVRRRIRRCIVVDDGSVDGTSARARHAGAQLIIHPHNRGKGAALYSALAYLREDPPAYVVLLDADGQHDPSESHRLLETADRRKADVVCGTRMRDHANMPSLRYRTNRVISGIVSWLCRIQLTDAACGFRVLSRRAVEVIRLHHTRYDVDQEMLFEAVRHGLTIAEAPVSTIYTDEAASYVRPFKDTVRFIRLVSGLVVLRIVRGRIG